MAEHYYTVNPEVAHDEKQVIFEVLDMKFSCYTWQILKVQFQTNTRKQIL